MYTRQHLTKSPKKGGRVRVTLMPAALVIGLLIYASLTTGAHTPWATVATPDTAPQSGGDTGSGVESVNRRPPSS